MPQPIADGGGDRPTTAPPSQPPARRALVLLMLCGALAMVDRLLLAQLVGPLQRDLGVDDLQIALLLGLAFSLPFAVAALPFGRWIDTRRRGTVGGVAVALWSLMTAMGGLCDSYECLLATRVGVGLGEAAIGPLATSLIADLFERRRVPVASALFSLGMSLGIGLAFALGAAAAALDARPPVSLPLLGAVQGWRLSLILVGLPGLLLAAGMAFLPEPPRRGSLLGRSGWGTVFTYVRREKALAAGLTLGLVAAFVVTHAVLSWLSTYFERVHSVPPQAFGARVGAVVLVCTSGGILLGGWLSAALLRRGVQDATVRAGMLGTVVAVPFMTLAPLAPDATTALALFAPAMLFGSVKVSIGMSTIQLVAPNEVRGQLAALLLLCTSMTGAALGPALVALAQAHVFDGPQDIGKALSLVCGVAGTLSGLALAAAMRPLRRAALTPRA